MSKFSEYASSHENANVIVMHSNGHFLTGEQHGPISQIKLIATARGEYIYGMHGTYRANSFRVYGKVSRIDKNHGIIYVDLVPHGSRSRLRELVRKIEPPISSVSFFTEVYFA